MEAKLRSQLGEEVRVQEKESLRLKDQICSLKLEHQSQKDTIEKVV
jgi:hypothetical protein